MNREDVLTTAIRKAIDNGYKIMFSDWKVVDDVMVEGNYKGEWMLKDWEAIVYDIRFAQSLWPSKTKMKVTASVPPELRDSLAYGAETLSIEMTEADWHLRQMVMSKNPLKYLSQHM